MQAAANVKVSASTLELTGSIVYVNSTFTRFSGTIQADTLIATSVVAASYTPGAGNVW